MTKRERVIKVLETMGYKPQLDDDGDVLFRYQMKTVYVLGTQLEDMKYLDLMLHLQEMKEGDEIKTLTVCNRLTRDVTLAKVYIDKTFKNIAACCEFYYCDEVCMSSQIEKSLDILGRVRSVFIEQMIELDE